MLYIIPKKKRKNLFNNIILFKTPIIKNKILLHIYFKYIKLNKNSFSLSNLNSTYIESYGMYKKNSDTFKLINTYFPKIYLKDNLLYKTILINHNYLDLNYLFVKSIFIPENIVIQITHRQLIDCPTVFFRNNKFFINNSSKLYMLYKNYIYITLYYSYWKNLFNTKNTVKFYKGLSLTLRKDLSTSILKDITSGLIYIEIVFEARNLSNSYLIPSKLSILNNIFLSYEDTTLNYLWNYNLYTFTNNTLLFFTEINTTFLEVYENKTSILLPNNIITTGGYSINILTLKLFSNNLNYYTQDKAVIITHIFIYNLIIESLLKQYFKNGIIIPSIQFELIAKKMTSFVKINYVGDSSLIENDIFAFSRLRALNYSLSILGYKEILYTPIILGITKSILAYSGFFASISFQEIIKYIINLSMGGSIDWLTDLKAKIITTDLVQVGSGWHRHFIKI